MWGTLCANVGTCKRCTCFTYISLRVPTYTYFRLHCSYLPTCSHMWVFSYLVLHVGVCLHAPTCGLMCAFAYMGVHVPPVPTCGFLPTFPYPSRVPTVSPTLKNHSLHITHLLRANTCRSYASRLACSPSRVLTGRVTYVGPFGSPVGAPGEIVIKFRNRVDFHGETWYTQNHNGYKGLPPDGNPTSVTGR